MPEHRTLAKTFAGSPLPVARGKENTLEAIAAGGARRSDGLNIMIMMMKRREVEGWIRQVFITDWRCAVKEEELKIILRFLSQVPGRLVSFIMM